jgi:hypothetical protein
VTVIVPIIGEVPALVPVKDAIFPEPLAPSPIDVLLLAQANEFVPPVLVEVKLIAADPMVLQITWLATASTSPFGLIVIVNVLVDPAQPVPPFVNVGVTTMVPVIIVFVAFVPVNEIFPVPEAARPMLVLLLVQEYVDDPPEVVVVKFTVAVLPAQTVWFPGLLTCPVGLIYMIKLFVGPEQLVPPFVYVGVTTIVPDMGEVPALVAVNEMFPEPLAAKPIEVLLFVHA